MGKQGMKEPKVLLTKKELYRIHEYVDFLITNKNPCKPDAYGQCSKGMDIHVCCGCSDGGEYERRVKEFDDIEELLEDDTVKEFVRLNVKRRLLYKSILEDTELLNDVDSELEEISSHIYTIPQKKKKSEVRQLYFIGGYVMYEKKILIPNELVDKYVKIVRNYDDTIDISVEDCDFENRKRVIITSDKLDTFRTIKVLNYILFDSGYGQCCGGA